MTTPAMTVPTLEEGLRAARRLRRMRLRRYGPLRGQPIELPELDGIQPPPLRPTSPRPDLVPLVHATDRFTRFYRPDGTVIDLPFEQAAAEYERLRLVPGGFCVARSVRYRRGVRLLISTVFLGLDSNYMAVGPPVLWETMIFHAGTPRNLGDGHECWRYAARDAALHGHRMIVHALDSARRARRG